MKKNNVYYKKPNSNADNFSNCHRTSGSNTGKNQSAQVSETESDVDSANSKYVVNDDKRPRKDGPGGN